jgi:GT2 family glycosyltransferase
MLVEHTVVRRLVSPSWLDRHYFLGPGAVPGPTAAAMVQGACFAFRRELIERVGYFDEQRFFLYWEETDFCRRARQAGWRVLYCPQVCCRHLGGGSTPDPETARWHFWRGLIAYYRKYQGPFPALLLRCALLAGIAGEVGLLTSLRLGRPGDRRLRADLDESWRRIVHLVATRPPRQPV